MQPASAYKVSDKPRDSLQQGLSVPSTDEIMRVKKQSADFADQGRSDEEPNLSSHPEVDSKRSLYAFRKRRLPKPGLPALHIKLQPFHLWTSVPSADEIFPKKKIHRIHRLRRSTQIQDRGHLSLMGILSSDYSPGPALAFSMLSLALICKCAHESGRRSPKWWLLASGFAYAMSVNSHLASVCYTFSIPLYYVLVAEGPEESLLTRIGKLGLWFSSGILVCVLVLGLLNVGLAGSLSSSLWANWST